MTSAPSRNDRLRVLKADNESFSHSLSLSRGKIEKEMSMKWNPTGRIRKKTLDTEIAEKIRDGNNKMSEYLYTLANEPSIGLFHVNSHIKQTVPKIVELRKELSSKTSNVEALNYDMDDTIITIQRLGAIDSFKNILFSLKKSLMATESLNRRKKFGNVDPYPIDTYNFPKPKSFNGVDEDSYLSDYTSSNTIIKTDIETSISSQVDKVDFEGNPSSNELITDMTSNTGDSIEQPSENTINENKVIPIQNEDSQPNEDKDTYKFTSEEVVKENQGSDSSPNESSLKSPFKGNMQFEIKGRSKKKKGTKKKTNTLTPKNF